MRRQKAKTYQQVLNNDTPRRVESAFFMPLCLRTSQIFLFYFINCWFSNRL